MREADLQFGYVAQHLRSGGYYRVLAVASEEATETPVVVYEACKDGRIWTRPVSEFIDGRFQAVDAFEIHGGRWKFGGFAEIDVLKGQLQAAEVKAAEFEAAARSAMEISETVARDIQVTFSGDAQTALTYLMLALWRSAFGEKPIEEQNFLLMPFDIDMGELDGGASTGREKFMLALQRAGGKTPGERWQETEAKRKALHEVLVSVTDSLEMLLDGRDGFAPLLPVGAVSRGVVEGAFVGVQEKIKEVMR